MKDQWAKMTLGHRLLALLGVGFVVLVGIAIVHPAKDEPTGSSPDQEASVTGPDITLLASRSYCVPTGVDDIYTGDGHIRFFVTVRNHGDADGKVDLTPVSHYDDGEMNESAMNESAGNPVAAGETLRYQLDPLKYEAHAHEVVGCGVLVDGQEVEIEVR